MRTELDGAVAVDVDLGGVQGSQHHPALVAPLDPLQQVAHERSLQRRPQHWVILFRHASYNMSQSMAIGNQACTGRVWLGVDNI